MYIVIQIDDYGNDISNDPQVIEFDGDIQIVKGVTGKLMADLYCTKSNQKIKRIGLERIMSICSKNEERE
jgi:hypothetical protein